MNRTVPQRTATAITNVSVFDDRHHGGETITEFVPNIETIVDGTGKFLIPGFMDSHLHPNTCNDLKILASYGVTTAFQMACYDYAQCNMLQNQEGVANIIRSGLPAVGPNSPHSRLGNFSASQLLSPDSNITATVEYAFNNGSDFYKIIAEINGPTIEQQKELVEQVHALGRMTMTHASHPEFYLQAIESGTDGLQHIFSDGELDASTIARIKAHENMFVTPTMEVFRIAYAHPKLAGLLQGPQGFGNTTFADIQKNVQKMLVAGVPLLAGTDSVGDILLQITGASLPFGPTLHCELENFVDIGMTLAEAIRSATVAPAAWHRITDRGVILPGMRADLVLLNSDPLVNISNTRDIAHSVSYLNQSLSSTIYKVTN
ncbi:hypothetical protein J3R30DRAFT_3656975 [Lentinula aciculospora]|uniref:Amidohydrolase-related domain-containing protein n=1 Tax=Lentinula aciculospora TaxID=153920 RepID=A0A9W9ADE5_9AGAR|nr:hypothetical protein J3R30DRAFT_3656975 [Lentinula aciculospora]